jgi:hypothetical protein
MDRMARLAPAVALLSAVAAGAGCGGGSAERKPASQARVDGQWRVVLGSQKLHNLRRVRWRTTAACAKGPCTFHVRSSTGKRFDYRFRKGRGDYVVVTKFTAPCGNARLGTLIHEAYRVTETNTLRVDRRAESGGADYATRLAGDSRQDNSVIPKARTICRPQVTTHNPLRAYRIDKP